MSALQIDSRPGDRSWTPPRLAVCVDTLQAGDLARAAELAAELGVALLEWPVEGFDLVLAVTADGLELRETGRRAPGPVSVGFLRAGERHLRAGSGLLKQPLARAVGARGSRPTVWDVTAGLGRDAFLLACVGCSVTAVERSAVLGAMLRDGLARAARVAKLRPVVQRVRVLVGDSRELLRALPVSKAPDVVYLDPMFAARKASALVKKEMRVLRRLVGEDLDAAELFETAMSVARRRVVVKRLRHAPPLVRAPEVSYQGKIARYDVYLRGERC